MGFSGILQHLALGLRLLMNRPFRWYGLAVVLLILEVSPMLLPLVGGIIKVMLSALFSATLMRVFAAADRGETPHFAALFAFHRLSRSGLAAVILAAILSFAASLGLMAWQYGADSVSFVFASVLDMDSPSAAVFQRFRISLYLFSMPFVFVPPAVALKGLGGWRALRDSVTAAIRHWRVPVLLFLFSFGYELLMARLPEFFPLLGVLLVALLLAPFFVLAMQVFTYELGKRALGYSVTA